METRETPMCLKELLGGGHYPQGRMKQAPRWHDQPTSMTNLLRYQDEVIHRGIYTYNVMWVIDNGRENGSYYLGFRVT